MEKHGEVPTSQRRYPKRGKIWAGVFEEEKSERLGTQQREQQVDGIKEESSFGNS